MAIEFDYIFGHSEKKMSSVWNACVFDWQILKDPSKVGPGIFGLIDNEWRRFNDPDENKPLINLEDILAFRPNKKAEAFQALHPDYQMARQREAYEALKQQLEEENTMLIEVKYKGKTYRSGEKYHVDLYGVRTIARFVKMDKKIACLRDDYRVYWEEGDWNSLSYVYDHWTYEGKKKTMEFKVGDLVKKLKSKDNENVYTILDAKYTDMVQERIYLLHKYLKDDRPHQDWFTASELELISRPSQTENHFVDALRYAFLPFRNKESKPTLEEIQKKLEKCDYNVKIIKSDFLNYIGKTGKVVKIEGRSTPEKTYCTQYHIRLDDVDGTYCTTNEDGELEFLIPKPALKFKIGDKIKVVKTTHCFPERLNQTGVVVEIEGCAGMSYLIKLDNTQLWLCEEDIEKLEDTPEPKIDAVVKCLDTMDMESLYTIGKYYIVTQEDEDGYTLLKDDTGTPVSAVGNKKLRFKAFKVGDKFKYKYPSHSEITILKFVIDEGGDIQLYYRWDETGYSTSCTIRHFDTWYTKIEDEPVKQEPKPKFELGQRVKISGCFDHLKEGYVIYRNYNESRSEFTYSVEDAIGDDKRGVGNVSEKDLKLVEESESEWQPKFKVGDWITNDYGCICQVICIYLEKRYYIFRPLSPNQYGKRAQFDEPELFETQWDFWQPMQELKDQNEAQAKNIRIHLARIQDLESNAIRLRTLIDAKNKMLDREYKANRALRKEIETLQKSHLAYVKLMKIVTEELASQIKK